MFKKAKRIQAKLKLAITGPSGSGKTFSALKLAQGMGGRIAVIDTENCSASLYSNLFDFDVCEIAPPFTTEKYLQAIKDAEANGFSTVIIDSLTHAWAGEGGLLEQKEQLDSRGRGNSYTNWGVITKKHEQFKAAILHSKVHVICTMRSKQEYMMSEGDKGKQTVKKLGMAPIQRDGMEYEFTTVFDVAMNHEAEVSKDRTGLFPVDEYFKITEATGEKLIQWLNQGEAAPEPVPTTSNEQDQVLRGKVLNRFYELGLSPLDLQSWFECPVEDILTKDLIALGMDIKGGVLTVEKLKWQHDDTPLDDFDLALDDDPSVPDYTTEELDAAFDVTPAEVKQAEAPKKRTVKNYAPKAEDPIKRLAREKGVKL